VIQSIEADNYKCLSGITFRCNKLTLLTGTNSVGKSSLLQSLLLTRLSSLRMGDVDTVVPLNGPYDLALGEFVDILRHDVGGRAGAQISIQLKIAEINYSLLLTADIETARYARFEFQPYAPEICSKKGLGSFCYLSAEREGPRNYAVIQSLPKERIEIGSRGQFVANVLSTCERDPVIPELEHPSVQGQRLLKQAEAWLLNFVPDVEVRVEAAQGIDVAAIRFKRGGLSAEWERPSNTGFGVSYCLPIVVAGLVAKSGSILLVDSPEAHLHPRAQSAMGSFLARLAAAGIQVFVETHSDHILNGIRLAAVDESHPFERESLVINHLRLLAGAISKEEIVIDSKGSLSSRPDEFFDQAENDLAEIVRKRFGPAKDFQ
jgi:predicted ATPase